MILHELISSFFRLFRRTFRAVCSTFAAVSTDNLEDDPTAFGKVDRRININLFLSIQVCFREREGSRSILFH